MESFSLSGTPTLVAERSVSVSRETTRVPSAYLSQCSFPPHELGQRPSILGIPCPMWSLYSVSGRKVAPNSQSHSPSPRAGKRGSSTYVLGCNSLEWSLHLADLEQGRESSLDSNTTDSNLSYGVFINVCISLKVFIDVSSFAVNLNTNFQRF